MIHNGTSARIGKFARREHAARSRQSTALLLLLAACGGLSFTCIRQQAELRELRSDRALMDHVIRGMRGRVAAAEMPRPE